MRTQVAAQEASPEYKWGGLCLICGGQDACLLFTIFLWKRLKGGILPYIKKGSWCMQRSCESSHEWEWVGNMNKHSQRTCALASFGKSKVKVQPAVACAWKRTGKQRLLRNEPKWAALKIQGWVTDKRSRRHWRPPGRAGSHLLLAPCGRSEWQSPGSSLKIGCFLYFSLTRWVDGLRKYPVDKYLKAWCLQKMPEAGLWIRWN